MHFEEITSYRPLKAELHDAGNRHGGNAPGMQDGLYK